MGEDRPGVYRARWLVFTADDGDVTRVEQQLLNLDNVALVRIKQEALPLSVDKRFEVIASRG